MATFTDDHQCFVCGQQNPFGLKAGFRKGEGTAEADVMFPAFLQGWKNTVHGGALATVLDEVMVQAAMGGGATYVTAEITVAYKKPAAPGVSYRIAGKVIERKGRIASAEASLQDREGTLYAKATAKLFLVG